MTKKTYKKLYINPQDPLAGVLNSVQDQIEQSVTPIAESEIVDGNLIKEIDTTIPDLENNNIKLDLPLDIKYDRKNWS